MAWLPFQKYVTLFTYQSIQLSVYLTVCPLLSIVLSCRFVFLSIPPLFCISTSEWVLRMLFAGRNRLSGAKTTFSVTNGTK